MTGKEERLLRSLSLAVYFGASGTQELRKALGSLAGAHIDFELTIAGPERTRREGRSPGDRRPLLRLTLVAMAGV